MMNHTLEADSIILEFGKKRVLQDVYIKSETGKITGLLGRNGTGKTCLLNVLYGKLIPVNYSVRVDSKSQLTSTRQKNEMMYLPQFSYIPKSLSLKRIFKDFNLDFSGFKKQFPEFDKYYKTKINKLSGGERRIIEICVILLSKTKFCLLDEPFSHVMPVHLDSIKRLIKKESSKKGIIITDHLYEHILEICDNIYVISNGKTHLIKNKNDLVTLGYTTSLKNSQ
ncbi:MAG: ATP-binding cassette domain-containing protein [Bacteroidales bacterium]|nr:ATP-binding cassette domain-containing protein [Bacteroidales bacterium]